MNGVRPVTNGRNRHNWAPWLSKSDFPIILENFQILAAQNSGFPSRLATAVTPSSINIVCEHICLILSWYFTVRFRVFEPLITRWVPSPWIVDTNPKFRGSSAFCLFNPTDSICGEMVLKKYLVSGKENCFKKYDLAETPESAILASNSF